MKKTSTILLLSLMLFPLFWNSISFVHHLVEHTHTFCASEQDHQHTSTEDCQTICHISPQHDQGQVPHKIEFYELKQCLSSFSPFNTQLLLSNRISISPDYSLLYEKIISEDIYRPPIS